MMLAYTSDLLFISNWNWSIKIEITYIFVDWKVFQPRKTLKQLVLLRLHSLGLKADRKVIRHLVKIECFVDLLYVVLVYKELECLR